jgi:hypothetical protein
MHVQQMAPASGEHRAEIGAEHVSAHELNR